MCMAVALCTEGKMHWVIFILTVLNAGISSDAQSITLVKDTVLPVKGSSFGMSCILSVPFTSNGITLLRNGNTLVSCTPRGCAFGNWYTYKVNQTGVFITIISLDRDSHEGSWTCTCAVGTTNIISNPLNLYVYTLPTGIHVTQEPSENVDLSMTSATFQCRTIGCSYPDPIIQWMYEDQVIATGVQTSTSDGCTSTEKIYTSTLFLQRNIALSDNSDKTVIFSCMIYYPDTSINIRANATKSVRFAVMVKWAQLHQNDHTVTDPTLTVTLGEPSSMTCTTGTSRPAPTIVWYIGSEKSGNGTSLTLAPSNAHHDMVIYCQAYNIDPSQSVSSNKPRLFVRVKVTEASLQQNGQTVLDKTLTVTSGKPSTLSCVTGSSRPAANIDWYIGSQKRGNGTSLNFIPTNEDHDKAIYCQAYNIDPNQPVLSNKPILFVRAAPKILDVSTSYKGYVGQCITIQFDFYSNTNENLTTTAQHSNSGGLIHQGIIRPSLPDDLQVYSPPVQTPDFRTILAISMKSENDFGQYHVEVKNIVGSDSKIIQIIKQITPEKPINFHVTNIQEKQLSLKWLSGYLWGLTQTFVVEASIDNITWNNVSQVRAGNRDGWFSTIVGDLIPGSEYYLRLYAYNINGRGDFADVQLEVRTLKESAYTSSMDVDGAVGIGVGGAFGVGVGGAVVGLSGAIVAFIIRRRLNGNKSSCFRSKRKTDDELHSYSNTEMNPHTVKPIYEELNKENTERSVYDKISPL